MSETEQTSRAVRRSPWVNWVVLAVLIDHARDRVLAEADTRHSGRGGLLGRGRGRRGYRRG